MKTENQSQSETPEKNFTDWFQALSPLQKQPMKDYLTQKCNLKPKEIDKMIEGRPCSEESRALLLKWTGINFKFGVKKRKAA